MDAIIAAARACASEIGRRRQKILQPTALDEYDNRGDGSLQEPISPNPAKTADPAPPRLTVDGDICASPADAAFKDSRYRLPFDRKINDLWPRVEPIHEAPNYWLLAGESAVGLTASLQRLEAAIARVVGPLGPAGTYEDDVAYGPDVTVSRARCGCSIQRVCGVTTHRHYCAQHGRGGTVEREG